MISKGNSPDIPEREEITLGEVQKDFEKKNQSPAREKYELTGDTKNNLSSQLGKPIVLP